MYMHMYIRMYAYMYIYIHTYERVHMHMRMHMHVHIHLQSLTHMAYENVWPAVLEGGVVSGCSVSSFWVQQEALTVNPKGLNLVFEGFRVSGPGEIGQARAFMQ